MIRVFKYPLLVTDGPQAVDFPKGAVILRAAMQGASPVMWAQVDDSTPKIRERRTFHVYGTGHEVGPEQDYIDSVFDGPFVWHIYEDFEVQELAESVGEQDRSHSGT